ncbi:hypothetical protein C8R46DRAFT_1357210 [Mycena filopes]|nr:hypothetical protein C8R46DRAFT_1357210 [Mycena filopes]
MPSPSPAPALPGVPNPLVHMPLERLRAVLGCLHLFRLFMVLVNSVAISHRFTFADTTPSISYGVRTFMLSKGLAWSLYNGGLCIARLVHAAAHGIDLDSRAGQFIPVHLSIEHLKEVGLHMPSISLILSYPHNAFLKRRFLTRVAAIRAAERFQDWVNHNLLWLAECIFRSRVKGPLSVWNFAAVVGLTKVEFYRRIAASNPSPLTDHAIHRAYGTFYFTALDLEIAQLIRPWFTHLGVLAGPTQLGVALYPVEHQLAGPMDAIMASGFGRMEDDGVDASERIRVAEDGSNDIGINF